MGIINKIIKYFTPLNKSYKQQSVKRIDEKWNKQSHEEWKQNTIKKQYKKWISEEDYTPWGESSKIRELFTCDEFSVYSMGAKWTKGARQVSFFQEIIIGNKRREFTTTLYLDQFLLSQVSEDRSKPIHRFYRRYTRDAIYEVKLDFTSDNIGDWTYDERQLSSNEQRAHEITTGTYTPPPKFEPSEWDNSCQ